jgi:hypothetical protein
MKIYTIDEWLAEGERLFGQNMLEWKFVCPSCGHVQTPEDFRPHKDKGSTPDSARFSCIGRYDGHMDTDMCSGKSPCNYTSGGLFKLAPITVIDADGKKFSCFAFAEGK